MVVLAVLVRVVIEVVQAIVISALDSILLSICYGEVFVYSFYVGLINFFLIATGYAEW